MARINCVELNIQLSRQFLRGRLVVRYPFMMRYPDAVCSLLFTLQDLFHHPSLAWHRPLPLSLIIRRLYSGLFLDVFLPFDKVSGRPWTKYSTGTLAKASLRRPDKNFPGRRVLPGPRSADLVNHDRSRIPVSERVAEGENNPSTWGNAISDVS